MATIGSRLFKWALALSFAGVLPMLVAAEKAEPWQAPPSKFEFKDYLIVPLRVHLLSASNDVLNTTLAPKDFDRIVPKMNRIWAQAGVSFYIESIVREDAINQELAPVIKKDFNNRKLLSVRPESSRATNVFHLYYIKEFPSNGVYIRDEPPNARDLLRDLREFKDESEFAKIEAILAGVSNIRSAMFVKDSASLKPAEGGIDEPLPRVSSHELGHALGLAHRQSVTNLMASGTTGVWFNEFEIRLSRAVAQRFDWIHPAPKVLAEADRLAGAKELEKARALYSGIANLPIEAIEVKHAKKQLTAHKK